MTYREFVEHAKANARRRAHTFTSPDDDWPITVIAEHRGESPHAFDLPGWIANSDHSKDALAFALGQAARDTRPLKIALITSAWMVERPLDTPLDDLPRPSEQPDRREIVMVIVIDPERSEGHMAGIKRSNRKPPTLGSWKQSDPGVSGRLAEPLIEALR